MIFLQKAQPYGGRSRECRWRASSIIGVFQATDERKKEQETWMDLQENNHHGRPWALGLIRTEEETGS